MRPLVLPVCAGLALAACQTEAATDESSSSLSSSSSPSTSVTSSASSSSSSADDSADTTADVGTGPEPTTDAPTTTSGEGSSTGDEPPAPVNGLRGEYFGTYINPNLTRVDPGVDFVWADGKPDASLGKDHFSIRWTGAVIAPTTGTYTIATESDDGVRVWIDDAPIIDDWNGHFVTRNEATVELQAGVPTPIRIDYFELDLDASMRLLWSSDGLPEQPIPASNLIVVDGPADLKPPKPPFRNPVVPFDCPDPGVLGTDEADGPHFYMVCTGGKFRIRHSRDLVLWKDTDSFVLPDGKPKWAANGNRNWAPELHRVGDKTIAYFTTVNGANVLSIGAASADSPLGPYKETAGPLVEHPLGVIDANYFADAGKHYLVYKIDGNSQGKPTPIFIRELRPDGLGFANGSDQQQILVNEGNTWEGGVVEATWLIKRNAFYYLFYSGNVYDHRYRTGVARSKSALGPYEKLGPPILANNGTWVGPGHGTVIAVEDLDYFVYHAWHNDGNGKNDGAGGRNVLVDRIAWEGGWPKISDGTPSHTAQLWPGVP